MRRRTANALLLAAGAIWGMGFVAQSTAMDDVPPLVFVALRFAIATLVVLPFAIAEARRASGPMQLPAFALIGLCLFGGIALQQVGLLTTSVTNSGFLTGLYVVFTPLLAVALFRLWPHPAIWPGAGLALAGIFLLAGGRLEGLAPGDWLTVLGAVFWALQVLFIARWVAGGRPFALATVQFAVCAAVAFCGAALFERFEAAAIWAAAPEILFTGILASGVAFTLQAIAQQHTSAAQAAIFLSSETLFAALFAALLLGERIGALRGLGCVLILVAMLVVELGPMARRKA